jgi:hypothetical protein
MAYWFVSVLYRQGGVTSAVVTGGDPVFLVRVVSDAAVVTLVLNGAWSEWGCLPCCDTCRFCFSDCGAPPQLKVGALPLGVGVCLGTRSVYQ